MRFIRLPYVLLISGFLIAALGAGAVNILELDWVSNHKALNTRIGSVDWIRYEFRRAVLYARQQFISDERVGLPQVRLYVPVRSQEDLMKNAPESTKVYRKAFMLYPDGSIQKVKIRYRGDNPINWLFGKKSLRIKASKKRLFDGRRVINLNVPQSDSLIELYLAFNAANDIGVLSPRGRLVEVFINDKSYGVLIEYDQPGELFLRRSGQMPVNLYKGEQAHIERSESIELDLYDNPSLWKKVAFGNDLRKNDYSDLEYFLDTIRRAVNNDQAYEQLKLIAPFSVWAQFAAYQTLTQNAHNTGYHNQRLMVDPWRGEVHPVLNDPFFLYTTGGGHGLVDRNFREIKKYVPPSSINELELDTQSLFRIFNRDSEFTYKKYQLLYEYLTKDKILDKALKRVDKITEPLLISASRDMDIGIRDANWPWWSVSASQDRLRGRINEYRIAIKNMTSWLTSQFDATPKAVWQSANGQIVLGISDFMPIKGLTLTLSKGAAVPSKIAWDSNGDGKWGSSDFQIPMKIKDGKVYLEAAWLANRSTIDTGLYRHSTDYPRVAYFPRATRFNLVADVPLSISEATGSNPFSRKSFVLPNSPVDGAWPSRRNLPVIKRKQPPLQIWNGVKRFEGTHYIDAPVRIESGTQILMAPGASLVFRGRLDVAGSATAPVRISALNKNKPFGLVALQGPGTAGSNLRYLQMEGGSGGRLLNIQYTGMLNIYNSHDIILSNVKLRDNYTFDDMIHVSYVNGIQIKNVEILNARSDGIDFDISKNVLISDGSIINSGNDGIDLMTSTVTIDNMTLIGNRDKGVSAGEESKVLVKGTRIEKNSIGIASKDGSDVQVQNTLFVGNIMQLNAYQKNWRYGAGGTIKARKSVFTGSDNVIKADKRSSIFIGESSLNPMVKPGKRVSFKNVTLAGDRMGISQ